MYTADNTLRNVNFARSNHYTNQAKGEIIFSKNANKSFFKNTTTYKFFSAPIEPKSTPNESKVLLFIVGVVIGAIAISTGTGGAIFLTPVLVGFMNWDIKKAVGKTLFFIIFGSISGFISLSANGLVDYDAGVAVGIGSLIGVYFGVKLSHYVSKTVQKRALLILYAIMFVLTLNKIVSELHVL